MSACAARAGSPALAGLINAAAVVAAFCGLALSPAVATAEPATLNHLQAKAQRMGLADHPQWRALLHIAPRVGRLRAVSDVNSAWFFVSGTRDADAELQATLAAFMHPAPVGPRAEVARCLFGARFAWLIDQLDVSPDAFPPADCTRRDTWLKALDPQRIWVVFPSAYLNSPASMFGHTLLRIDGPEGGGDNALLAYAVNYAAETEESNGLIFAVKGLAGGYRGSYAVMPYYEKVRDYSRIENRDLWEYPLALDDPQMRLLLLHLWEMRGAGFEYYFFNRNCAYQLQALLRVVRPDDGLIDGFRTWAIPTDTLRRLRNAGVAGAPQFRPALATRLAHRRRQVETAVLDAARDVVIRDASPQHIVQAAADSRGAARGLDIAHDWIYYRYQHGLAARETALPHARRVLAARAGLGVTSDFTSAPAPAAAPDQGHATSRGMLGGFADERASGVRLRWRPAYHDLLDPPAGYDAESQLAFFDLAIVRDTEREATRVDSLGLIDILSAAPRGPMFRPVSWFAWAGAQRRFSAADPLVGVIEAGPGLAFGDFERLGAAVFAVAGLETARVDDGYRLELGGRAQVVAQVAGPLRLTVGLQARDAVAGADRDWLQADAAGHWQWHPSWGVRVGGAISRVFGVTERRAELALVRYW